VRITVAVITFNRSRFLRETLAGLARQDMPAGEWELLVIDNNSTDDTVQVVAAFAASRPAPRHILETRQGLDHGRNRAVAEARGEIVVLVDDDILVGGDWLARLAEPFFSPAGGRIGVVGGEVVPVFPDGLPRWLERAHRPLGFRPDAGPLPPGQSPMGDNFAFPKAVLDRLGGFDTTLDRRGPALFGGGDTEMIRRVRKAGLEVWFAPAAAVRHQMPAERLTMAYALRHAFDSARSRIVDGVRERRMAGRAALPFLLSRAAGAALKLLGYLLAMVLAAAAFQGAAAKRARVRAWRSCGYLYQIARSAAGKL
jgi:glycosyltransferase involved in cell wall biosynthesis